VEQSIEAEAGSAQVGADCDGRLDGGPANSGQLRRLGGAAY
jgi:hypothetical protein